MKRDMTYPPELIAAYAKRNADNSATILVAEGETAWDPSTTKRVIHGPAKVRYLYFPDGAIEATVL